MRQFSQMQSQIEQLQQSQQVPPDYHELREKMDKYEGLESVIDNMKSRGYIKFTSDNNLLVSQSEKEQYEFMKEVQQESLVAYKIELENKAIARDAAHQERIRAINQLEPNEMMQAQMQNQSNNEGSLQNSVVLIDHIDGPNEQQQIDNSGKAN